MVFCATLHQALPVINNPLKWDALDVFVCTVYTLLVKSFRKKPIFLVFIETPAVQVHWKTLNGAKASGKLL